MATDSPVINPPSLSSTVFHPEYAYWANNWETIRDVITGEEQIKRSGSRYLPKPEAMDNAEYAAYLSRAVFYNMTARTIIGLTGSLFRRPGRANVPERLEDSADNITNYNTPLDQLVKQTAREVFTTGRYGVLMDMDADGIKPPYFSGYIAENIIDWTEEEINGRMVLTEVILRELRLDNQTNADSLPAIRYVRSGSSRLNVSKTWLASYRVLRLVNIEGQLVYQQFLFFTPGQNANIEGEPTSVYTPTNRGKPFDFIPFMFFGPNDNKPAVNKSPILDIVTLNLSHYTSYAQLEQGRWYTAQPVYYVPVGASETKTSYMLGPNIVWEVDKDSKPGILEYHGGGLIYLQNGCSEKVEQIAALGGRMMGQEKLGPGQSDNNAKMQASNESALLLNVSFTLDYGFSKLLKWFVEWQDGTPEEIEHTKYETNKSFILSNASAREFRAIQMMYQAGVIPLEVLFEYLSEAEVIPEWMDMDKFKELLEDEESFPNQADVHAQMEGAPDAKTQWETDHPDESKVQAAQVVRKTAMNKSRATKKKAK